MVRNQPKKVQAKAKKRNPNNLLKTTLYIIYSVVFCYNDCMEYDILVIGAGMAGLTSAIYGARASKSVLVLESKTAGGQILESRSVSNWPGSPEISGVDLMKEVENQAKKMGAEIKYEEVSNVSATSNGFLIFADENEHKAKTVIIATGTKPREMSAKQTADAGERPISYCATCDGALYAGKPVVVVGHGNTAKYEVKYLENIASKVYQIHHDDPIPEDAEAVFVAIGRVPYTDFLKGFVELDGDGYVMADENCKTSVPGVFVAGDCRVKSARQLVTAAADGAVAATEAIEYLADR